MVPRSQLDRLRHIEHQSKPKRGKEERQTPRLDGQCKGRSKRLDPASRADRPQAAPYGR